MIDNVHPGSTDTLLDLERANRLIALTNQFLALRPGAGVAINKAEGQTIIEAGSGSRCPVFQIRPIRGKEMGFFSASRVNQLVDAINFFRGIQAGAGCKIVKGEGRLLFLDGDGETMGEVEPLSRFEAGSSDTILSAERANQLIDAVNGIYNSEGREPWRLVKAESGWVLERTGEGGPSNTRRLNPIINWDGFPLWEIVSGFCDLCGVGADGIILYDFMGDARTMYVDLCGTQLDEVVIDPAVIRTRNTYPLQAGVTYQLSFELAGNNRVPEEFPALVEFGVGEDPENRNLFYTNVFVNWTAGFATYAYNFTPEADVDARIFFHQASLPQNPNVGCVLDGVKLIEVATGNIIFADAFDGIYPV